jgi:hypothetical protein
VIQHVIRRVTDEPAWRTSVSRHFLLQPKDVAHDRHSIQKRPIERHRLSPFHDKRLTRGSRTTSTEARIAHKARRLQDHSKGLRAKGERPHGADALGAAWARHPPAGWGRSPFARILVGSPRCAQHRSERRGISRLLTAYSGQRAGHGRGQRRGHRAADTLAPYATPGSNRARRQAVAPPSRVTVRTKRRVRFDDADDPS